METDKPINILHLYVAHKAIMELYELGIRSP